MSLLLAMLLSATAPSSVGVHMYSNGRDAGIARSINMTNCTVSCVLDYCSVTCAIGDGGTSGGIVYAPLDAGFWLAHAVASLPNGKDLGALDAGLVRNVSGTPIPYVGSTCGAGAFASSEDNNGNLTCSIPAGTCAGGSAGNLQTNGSGSCSAYAGATCAATKYASATSASGALTCDVPPGTCSGGTDAGSIQFNGNGGCSGLTNLLGDGTHELFVPVTTAPAPPLNNYVKPFALQPLAGFPPIPWEINSVIGQPMPTGVLSGFAMNGTTPPWRKMCCFAGIGANSSAPTCQGDDQTAPTVIAGAAGVAWDAGNYYGRNLKHIYQTAGTQNTNAGIRMASVYMWRGSNIGGAGGGLYWIRFGLGQMTQSTARVFQGLKFGSSSVIAANDNPSQEANVVFMGHDADAGNTNCSICSNDGTGKGPCTDLGSSFPCTTNNLNGFYDLWFYFAPSDGGTGDIKYYVQRLDSAATASGTLTSDLPIDYAQGTWQHVVGSAFTANTTAQEYFIGNCSAWGW